ncbi:hypothetical protein A2U01_0074962, partial [Trifolium medium]|nr:hypothetical protein [Trifolium medium]
DFDEATVSKQRYDVARVKLRIVRRSMIDTVVQLMGLGVAYDVWVVEERCGCFEDGRKEEENYHNSDRSSGSHGEVGGEVKRGICFLMEGLIVTSL